MSKSKACTHNEQLINTPFHFLKAHTEAKKDDYALLNLAIQFLNPKCNSKQQQIYNKTVMCHFNLK